MEEYKGFGIPKIKNKDILEGLCSGGRQCEEYDDGEDFDCDHVSCNQCLFNNPNKDLLREWLKTEGKHTPLNECFNKENEMNISDNILEVFENSKDAKKVAARFGPEYNDTTRSLLALTRDKDDLLKIIAAEEKEAKKDK